MSPTHLPVQYNNVISNVTLTWFLAYRLWIKLGSISSLYTVQINDISGIATVNKNMIIIFIIFDKMFYPVSIEGSTPTNDIMNFIVFSLQKQLS